MRHLFWLCVCVLLACVGCTNDVAHEKTGSTRSALAATCTFTQDSSTSAPYEWFDMTWAIDVPAETNIGGVLEIYDTTTDEQLQVFELGRGGGVHTFEVSLYSPGVHRIEARYTDGNFDPDTQVLEHKVEIPTEMGVWTAGERSSFVYGEPIGLDIWVSPSFYGPSGYNEGGPSVTGTVKLSWNSLDLGTCEIVDGSSSDCEVTGLPVGTDEAISAEFVPESGAPFGSSTDTSNGVDVTKASTTAIVASATPEPSVVGATVSFSVEVHAVAPSVLPPTGTVQLFRLGDASPTATVPVTSGSGAVSVVAVPVSSGAIVSYGTNVQAVFVPGTNHSGSTSAVYAHGVALDATQGALNASPSSSWLYGEPVTFTMTVSSSAPGAPSPSGSVLFYDGPVSPSSYIGTSVIHDSAGARVGTLTTSSLALGAHSITAVYQGDPGHAAVSATVSGQVKKATPTVDLVVVPSSSVYSQPVSFGAHVTGSGSTAPTGTIQFYVDSTTPIGSPVALIPGTGIASLVDASLSIGSNRVIRAVYSGDTRYATASDTTTLTIAVEPTSTSLTSSSEPATAGGDLTLTATVSKIAPATATPKGKVTFSEGGTTFGTVTVNASGVATITIPAPAAGTHEIAAAFVGDANFGNSQTSIAQHVVLEGVTSSLVSSVNPSITTNSVTFTATFGSATAGPATGTVTFFDGATSIGTGTLNGSGVATFSTSTLAAGTHIIKATYPGDATHDAGNATLVQTVTRIASSTNLTTTAPDVTTLGVAVPLKATITSTGGGTPSGAVSFKDGTTVLGTVALDATGSATFTASALGVGPHSFTAAFDGDPTHLPSASSALAHTVDKATVTVTLASSLNPAPVGFSVLLSATITGGAGGFVPTGSVTFKDGATTIGSGSINSSGVAQLSISTLIAGAHSITATFPGDAHFLSATSAVLSQSVSATASSIALSSSPNPSALGESVTLSVAVSGAGSTPTGDVTFKSDGAVLGAGTLDATGKATFPATTLAAGIHTLSVEYAGDDTHDGGTATTSHVVQKGVTTTTLTASATTAAPGDAITFSAKVSSAAGAVAGDVELFDATTSIGTATLASGGVTFSIANLTAGQHAITARYKGSDTFAGSISNSILVSIVTGGDADAGADGGGQSSGGVGSSSSSSGSPVGTGDSGAGVNASGGLDVTPGGGGSGGDDCAMTPGGAGSLTGPFLLGLIAVLARRRRKVGA